MVNKQYNIHNTAAKNKSKSTSPADDSDRTPSAFERNITQHYYQDNSDAFSDLLEDNCGDPRTATLSVQSVLPDTRKFNVIATTDDHLITTASATTNTSLDSDSQKPLSINDIGRFQYILQMDREMVSGSAVHFIHFFHFFAPPPPNLNVGRMCLFVFIKSVCLSFVSCLFNEMYRLFVCGAYQISA